MCHPHTFSCAVAYIFHSKWHSSREHAEHIQLLKAQGESEREEEMGGKNNYNSVWTYCRRESMLLIQLASWGCRPMNWQVQRSNQTPAGPGWGVVGWPPPCASLNTHMWTYSHTMVTVLKEKKDRAMLRFSDWFIPCREPLDFIYIVSGVWKLTCRTLRHFWNSFCHSGHCK